MAIALPLLVQIFEPINMAVQWLSGASSPAPVKRHPAYGSRTSRTDMDRPLRVIRVVEQRGPRTGAGRMVISGRMEDVCAELDRLAELETRH